MNRTILNLETETISRIGITISGRVQGVWFRASTQETARSIGLTGWVQNNPDGSVITQAQGTKTQLSRFIEWCRKGPPAAVVDQVDILELEIEPREFSFVIRK